VPPPPPHSPHRWASSTSVNITNRYLGSVAVFTFLTEYTARVGAHTVVVLGLAARLILFNRLERILTLSRSELLFLSVCEWVPVPYLYNCSSYFIMWLHDYSSLHSRSTRLFLSFYLGSKRLFLTFLGSTRLFRSIVNEDTATRLTLFIQYRTRYTTIPN
jgi:hypothetical protein